MSNMQSDPLLNGITKKCHLLSATNDKVVNKQLFSNDVSSSKSDQQLTEPQHISIQSSFNSLLTARKDDSSWIPTILLPIIVPLCIRHDMQTLDLNSTHTDIVPFSKEPSLIMKCLYTQTLKCGYVQRMLMPCHHICAVIKNMSIMFHHSFMYVGINYMVITTTIHFKETFVKNRKLHCMN